MAEKMTNADRIKKATDKELADMLCKINKMLLRLYSTGNVLRGTYRI